MLFFFLFFFFLFSLFVFFWEGLLLLPSTVRQLLLAGPMVKATIKAQATLRTGKCYYVSQHVSVA
ncbi:hypothetical protein L209DRAFT_751612 [Thermothelomyces heterothallicus CBS 203.75]